MTIIVDTSLWVALFKDKSGRVAQRIGTEVASETIVMPLPVRLELLQGCRGEQEWLSMMKRVEAFELLPMPTSTWDRAARLYFELRQSGKTVRSVLDCLIAQCCLDQDCILFHNDRDFEAIASVRPLKHRRLDLDSVTP